MSNVLYYFTTATEGTLPNKWWEKLTSDKQVIRPDTLYKCSTRWDIDITPEDISDDILEGGGRGAGAPGIEGGGRGAGAPGTGICIYEATISASLSKQKKYRVIEIAENILFYFDNKFGFLEFTHPSENSGDHAVEIFTKLLTQDPPYMFFFD